MHLRGRCRRGGANGVDEHARRHFTDTHLVRPQVVDPGVPSVRLYGEDFRAALLVDEILHIHWDVARLDAKDDDVGIEAPSGGAETPADIHLADDVHVPLASHEFRNDVAQQWWHAAQQNADVIH